MTSQAGADVGIHLFRPLVLRSMFARPTSLEASAWIEHIPFAFWLIEAQQPRVVVELGTHHGTSYFAFCQAVERLGLDARCFAVDTWKGDEHSGLYGESVFEAVRSHNDAQYSGFSRLIRSTFDAACQHFSNQTIDLLHIDGCHTLDAVTHDFEKWLPKLSERAVVLMHDTNVRERDFGVFRLFEKLQETFPAFEFVHGHGLGILGVGPEQNDVLKQLFKAGKDEQASRVTRDVFGRLGRACADARESSRLERELGSVRHRLGEAERSLEQVRHQLAQTESALAQQRHEAEETAGELAATREELQRTAAARAEMEKIATVLKEHVVLLMADVKERQAASAALQQARDAEGEAVASMAGQVKQVLAVLETSRHELAARLSDSERERNHQVDEIAALRRLVEETQGEASRERARADQLCHEAAGKMGSAVAGLLNGHVSPLSWRPFRLRRQAVLLERSGLFNAEWYVRQNPDVASAGIDPLRHYVEFGAREGRAPHPALALANGKADVRVETVAGPDAPPESDSEVAAVAEAPKVKP